MDYCTLEIESGIALLTVCRPQVLNALNEAAIVEMIDAISSVAANGNVKALILTGEGDKAFIAGADIKEMKKKEGADIIKFCRLGQQLSIAIEEAAFPTIAAINGYALGGGLEMALACDFIYARKGVKIGLPEVTLGLIPGFGGTRRLARAVGVARAKEMIYTGMTISTEEGAEFGMINALFSTNEELIAAAIKTAKRIARQSSFAIAQAKEAVNSGSSLPVKEALELECSLFALAFACPERRVIMEAFLDKRGIS